MAVNPYISKYRSELSERNDEYNKHLRDERLKTGLKYLAAGAAAVTVAHTLTPGGIVNLMDTSARAGHSALKASKDVLSERGVRGTLKNIRPAADEYRESFLKTMKDSSVDPLKNLAKEKENAVETIKEHLLKSNRYKSFQAKIDDLHDKDLIDDDFYRRVKEDLGRKAYGLGNTGPGNRNEILRKSGFAKEERGFLDNLIREVNHDFTYKDLDEAGEINQWADSIMKGMVNLHQDPRPSGPLSSIEKGIRGGFNKVFGYREATISDLRKHDMIDDDYIGFLNKLNKAGAIESDFILDERLLVNRTGRIVSAYDMQRGAQNLRSAFSQGILGKVTYQQDMMMLNKYQKNLINISKAGMHQPFIGDELLDQSMRLKETVVGIGDRLYKISDPTEAVRENVVFTSGRYASMKRLSAEISGLNRPAYDKWYESERLDITTEREPGFLKSTLFAFRKKRNPEWMPNKVNRFLNNVIDPSRSTFTEDNILLSDEVYDYLRINAPAFDEKLLRTLLEKHGFKDFDLDSDRGVLDILASMEAQGRKEFDREDFIRKRLASMDETITQTRTGFLSQNIRLDGRARAKKDISRWLVYDYGSDDILDTARKLFDTDQIKRSVLEDTEISVVEALFSQAYTLNAGKMSKEYYLKTLFGKNGKMTTRALDNLLNKTHPAFGRGPTPSSVNNFFSDTLILNKPDFSSLKGWWDVGTAGRRNLDDVSTATLGLFGMVSKLNNLVKEFDLLPLALSDSSMSSTPGAAKNIMTRRIMPAMAFAGVLKYTSDHFNEITGYTLSQHEERMKAQTRLNIAGTKDSLGITGLLKTLDSATPGSEGFTTALHDVPIIGWGLDWTGLLSSRSEEEWVDYYAHGEDPVRKGRFWPLGQTAWMGKGVIHYEPNSYRQAMAQWQYTDTVYGSRDEYWRNHWLPTPTHPFAPVRHFITDRYWWEEKHRKDRPYPLSGELFDPNTPWGQLLNPTIGELIKPVKSYGAGATKKDLEKQRAEDTTYGQLVYQYTNKGLQQKLFIPDKGGRYYGTSSQLDAVDTGEIEASEIKAISYKSDSKNTTRVPSGGYAASSPYQRDSSGEIGIPSAVELDSGEVMAMNSLSEINLGVIEKAREVRTINAAELKKQGTLINYRRPRFSEEYEIDVMDPQSLKYRSIKAYDQLKDILGFIGFLGDFVKGGDDYGEGESVTETASRAYSTSSRFWDMHLGGRGGALSEVLRRFWIKEPGLRKSVNNIPNMMPDWLPEEFQTGDAFTSVQRGEIRLPGGAYESMHQLHPDRYGTYGAVDRAAILADIAPYSQEFKYWLSVARSQDLDETENNFLQQALEQSRKQTERYHITPYKFRNTEMEKTEAVVEKFIDANRFMVKGSDRIYRLAGVYGSSNRETEAGKATIDILSEHMLPGSEVMLVTEKYSDGGTIPAVVFSGGERLPIEVGSMRTNINQLLRKSGATIREESGPISTYTEVGGLGRVIGNVWETVAHSRIPVIHNKIFAVNSPIEHLKRENIYGKTFHSWGEPYEDLVKPGFQNAFAQNPIGGSISGAFIGTVMAAFLFGNSALKTGATMGAVVGGTGSIWTRAKEMATGEAWIPEDKKKMREIDQYFDRLKYLKNKRLYNKYRKKSEIEDDINIEEIAAEMERLDEEIRDERKKYSGISRWLSKGGDGEIKTIVNKEGRLEYVTPSSKSYQQIERAKLNKRVTELSKQKVIVGLSENARKALSYRDRYESTLYAIDEESNYTEIFLSLSNTTKDYFKYFMQEQDPEKREEILKLLPEDEKRVMKIVWNMEDESIVEKGISPLISKLPGGERINSFLFDRGSIADERESLAEYFKEYSLPDEDWIGWREGVDLDHAKRKLVQEQGFDPKDFGLWRDHTESEKLTPSPVRPGEDFRKAKPGDIKKRIEDVLNSYDLKDVDVNVKPRDDNRFNITMNLTEDIREKVGHKIESALEF